MWEDPKLNKQLEDDINDFKMSRIDQTIILFVSFLVLILAVVGFSMSDMMYIFITS